MSPLQIIKYINLKFRALNTKNVKRMYYCIGYQRLAISIWDRVWEQILSLLFVAKQNIILDPYSMDEQSLCWYIFKG